MIGIVVAAALFGLMIGYLLGLQTGDGEHEAHVDALCRALEETRNDGGVTCGSCRCAAAVLQAERAAAPPHEGL